MWLTASGVTVLWSSPRLGSKGMLENAPNTLNNTMVTASAYNESHDHGNIGHVTMAIFCPSPWKHLSHFSTPLSLSKNVLQHSKEQLASWFAKGVAFHYNIPMPQLPFTQSYLKLVKDCQ